jgi:hypothetical protein
MKFRPDTPKRFFCFAKQPDQSAIHADFSIRTMKKPSVRKMPGNR